MEGDINECSFGPKDWKEETSVKKEKEDIEIKVEDENGEVEMNEAALQLKRSDLDTNRMLGMIPNHETVKEFLLTTINPLNHRKVKVEMKEEICVKDEPLESKDDEVIHKTQEMETNGAETPEADTVKEQSQQRQSVSSNTSQPSKQKKHSKNSDYVNTAINKMEEISEKATMFVKNKDAFDHFAKYIASILRGLPLSQSVKLQRQIEELVLKEQMAALIDSQQLWQPRTTTNTPFSESTTSSTI